jgi:hypothetical protein
MAAISLAKRGFQKAWGLSPPLSAITKTRSLYAGFSALLLVEADLLFNYIIF